MREMVEALPRYRPDMLAVWTDPDGEWLKRTEVLDALATPPTEQTGRVTFSWVDGIPPSWWDEWFIAELNDGHGSRVVLKYLDQPNGHDFTTSDYTFYTKDWVAKWMPFPDSQYKHPLDTKPEAATLPQSTIKANNGICKDCGYLVVDGKCWCEPIEDFGLVIRDTLGDERRLAFIQGAKWWEFHSTKGTMWQSDQKLVAEAAERRYDGSVMEIPAPAVSLPSVEELARMLHDTQMAPFPMPGSLVFGSLTEIGLKEWIDRATMLRALLAARLGKPVEVERG